MTFICSVKEWADKCVENPYWLACCLQRLGRFGGQHPRSNVLIHSLAVHDLVFYKGSQVRLWALYHDAHEVLSGEITRPFKSMDIVSIQTHLDEVLKKKLGITADVSAVTEADTLHGDYEAEGWANTTYRILACPVFIFCDLVRELRG